VVHRHDDDPGDDDVIDTKLIHGSYSSRPFVNDYLIDKGAMPIPDIGLEKELSFSYIAYLYIPAGKIVLQQSPRLLAISNCLPFSIPAT